MEGLWAGEAMAAISQYCPDISQGEAGSTPLNLFAIYPMSNVPIVTIPHYRRHVGHSIHPAV